jgi:GTPase SAR1 family protein
VGIKRDDDWKNTGDVHFYVWTSYNNTLFDLADEIEYPPNWGFFTYNPSVLIGCYSCHNDERWYYGDVYFDNLHLLALNCAVDNFLFSLLF